MVAHAGERQKPRHDQRSTQKSDDPSPRRMDPALGGAVARHADHGKDHGRQKRRWQQAAKSRTHHDNKGARLTRIR
ncbi:MAG TPA: hypothetical protein DCL54_06705 [Alphaproteobacteria bacterium]|nr:hypothetical protein [Alphaproteobacteria bacterium]HAJ46252.1 hypothetical protein [Alphaproteobacteria bacterium]